MKTTLTTFDAIRCDYSEYKSLQDWADEYFTDSAASLGLELNDDGELDDEKADEKIREYIHDHGQLIEFGGGVIVSRF